MKIKWGVEGVCNLAQCGSVERTIEIPDEDLEGLSEMERDKLIDEYVTDEFTQHVSFFWNIQGKR